MATPDYFQAIFDYNQATNERVWDSIMTLTAAQFIALAAYGHGSVRDQIIHLASTEAGWLRGIQGDPAAQQFRLEPADYPTRAAARQAYDDAVQPFNEYIAGLDEAELARTPTGMGGPIWQILAHLANHGTDHRAQLLRTLHDHGAPTFGQDMIFHLWRR